MRPVMEILDKLHKEYGMDRWDIHITLEKMEDIDENFFVRAMETVDMTQTDTMVLYSEAQVVLKLIHEFYLEHREDIYNIKLERMGNKDMPSDDDIANFRNF